VPSGRAGAFSYSPIAEAQRETDEREVSAMSEEEIKAELKARGILPPAGDTEELMAALLNARSDLWGQAYDREADEAYAMSEEQIKAELKALGAVPPAVEKEGLVAALLVARANLWRKAYGV